LTEEDNLAAWNSFAKHGPGSLTVCITCLHDGD
jgi:hypothetical protein